MRRFKIADRIIEANAEDLQRQLAEAHRRKVRPLCGCKEPGPAMYIAQVGDEYIVKRMPLSGGGHDPSCPSYEPPDELSGLGMLMGSAIQVDPESGIASLKLDFSLSKVGSRKTPGAAAASSDTVAGDAKKLSLRGLLHYLWHEAELTSWTARWTGKRHWWNIRWHLIETAGQMSVKGGMLRDILFVPEPFRSADKVAIEQRRARALLSAQPPENRSEEAVDPCWRGQGDCPGSQRPQTGHQAYAGIRVPNRRRPSASASIPLRDRAHALGQ